MAWEGIWQMVKTRETGRRVYTDKNEALRQLLYIILKSHIELNEIHSIKIKHLLKQIQIVKLRLCMFPDVVMAGGHTLICCWYNLKTHMHTVILLLSLDTTLSMEAGSRHG